MFCFRLIPLSIGCHSRVNDTCANKGNPYLETGYRPSTSRDKSIAYAIIGLTRFTHTALYETGTGAYCRQSIRRTNALPLARIDV